MTRTTMLILGLAGLALGACNTVEGAGQDVQYTGAFVTEAADEVGDEIEQEVED